MNNAIKCVNCKHVLSSPVLLPCSHSICQKHTVDVKGPIICGQCEKEHEIPQNTGFLQNSALAQIIEAQEKSQNLVTFLNLDFGKEHRETKHSCQYLDDLLNKIDEILKDPYNFTYEAITYLKNAVQLKGEEMKMKIDNQMSGLISKLDEYNNDCKKNLTTKEYLTKLEEFRDEKEDTRKELDKWTDTLNDMKFKEKEWKIIKEESDDAIEDLEAELLFFKTDVLLQNRFDKLRAEIEDTFGEIEINPLFNLNYSKMNMTLNSKILDNFKLKYDLSQLCGFKSFEKWSLLYRGSSDGFSCSSFHDNCDNIPKTLILIKTTNSNIFGGYTEATWDQSMKYKSDKNAYLFSLVNDAKIPVKLNIANDKESESIFCGKTHIPIFGNIKPHAGSNTDMFIKYLENCSSSTDMYFTYSKNNSAVVYLNFGKSYSLDKSISTDLNNCFTASRNYDVEEFEVFQIK